MEKEEELLKKEKIFKVHEKHTESILEVLKLMEDTNYLKIYFLHLYASPNIRMEYQLRYLKRNLTKIIKRDITHNREDLIIKMIWIYWISTIPAAYENMSMSEFEQKEHITFETLEQKLNQILVFTLSEDTITYDPKDVVDRMKQYQLKTASFK